MSKALKKPYFTKPGNRVSGDWLLLKRYSAENGGGSECVQVFSGNFAQARARATAQIKNRV